MAYDNRHIHNNKDTMPGNFTGTAAAMVVILLEQVSWCGLYKTHSWLTHNYFSVSQRSAYTRRSMGRNEKSDFNTADHEVVFTCGTLCNLFIKRIDSRDHTNRVPTAQSKVDERVCTYRRRLADVPLWDACLQRNKGRPWRVIVRAWTSQSARHTDWSTYGVWERVLCTVAFGDTSEPCLAFVAWPRERTDCMVAWRRRLCRSWRFLVRRVLSKRVLSWCR